MDQMTKNASAELDRNDPFDDDINEAMDDAASNGEGRITARYARYELAKRGLVIVPVEVADAVRDIASRTKDYGPPFRVMPPQEMIRIAQAAAILMRDGRP